MGTAIRVAGGAGSAGGMDAGTAAADADGFSAVLTAATSGTRRGGEGVASQGAAPADPLAPEEGDAALAAALAALLPAGAQPEQQAPADGEGAGSLDEVLAGASIPVAVRSGAPRGQGRDPADLQAAGIDAGAGEGEAANALVERLARELAAVREPAATLRIGAGPGPAAGGEAPVPSGSTLSPLPLAGLMAAGAAAEANAEGSALRSPVGTPRWTEELGSRLVMMTTRGQHEGSLTLAPEDLGPLEVRISVQQNTAHVWFGAQHADTRAALAEALPRLREMFAEAGLSLGHTGVSQEAPGQRPDEGSAVRSAGRSLDAAPAEVEAPVRRRAAPGLIDLYA